MSKSKKQKLSSKEESKIWFHLYDSANGLPYMGTTADYVSIPSSAVIAQFRKAVKAEYDQPGYLKDIPSELVSFVINLKILFRSLDMSLLQIKNL